MPGMEGEVAREQAAGHRQQEQAGIGQHVLEFHARDYNSRLCRSFIIGIRLKPKARAMERFEDIDSRLDTAKDFVRWGASAFNRAKLHFEHGTSNAVDEALNLVLPGLSLGHDIPPWLLDARLTAGEK